MKDKNKYENSSYVFVLCVYAVYAVYYILNNTHTFVFDSLRFKLLFGERRKFEFAVAKLTN